MSRARPAASLLAAALLLATATACGSARATSPAPSTTPAATMTSPAPDATACPDGPATLTHNPGDSRDRSVCVRSGATLTITLHPARGYQWIPLESSDPQVAAVVETHVDADGGGHATIHAGRPGTATITSSDTYTPDRFGPPTQLWTLRLQVR